eukprot:scaffold5373_cov182-Cylindrotheca_fusiformis.AAC.1
MLELWGCVTVVTFILPNHNTCSRAGHPASRLLVMDGWRLVLRGCTWKVLVFCACANLRARK